MLDDGSGNGAAIPLNSLRPSPSHELPLFLSRTKENYTRKSANFGCPLVRKVDIALPRPVILGGKLERVSSDVTYVVKDGTCVGCIMHTQRADEDSKGVFLETDGFGVS